MSVKIKISYNTDKELQSVIKLLSPVLRDYKVKKNNDGHYKKAYVNLSDSALCSDLVKKKSLRTQ